MKLTKSQLRNLRYMVRSQIDWREGGCFGDGGEIVDKVGLKSAEKILEKIDEELDSK